MTKQERLAYEYGKRLIEDGLKARTDELLQTRTLGELIQKINVDGLITFSNSSIEILSAFASLYRDGVPKSEIRNLFLFLSEKIQDERTSPPVTKEEVLWRIAKEVKDESELVENFFNRNGLCFAFTPLDDDWMRLYTHLVYFSSINSKDSGLLSEVKQSVCQEAVAPESSEFLEVPEPPKLPKIPEFVKTEMRSLQETIDQLGKTISVLEESIRTYKKHMKPSLGRELKRRKLVNK